MNRITGYITFFAIAAAASSAQAHFVWLVPKSSSGGNTVVNVYFGEDASDDSTDYLSRVQGIRLHRVTGTDAPSELQVTSTDEGISATADLKGHSVVVTSHDLGVMDRGDSVFRLKYYGKAGPAITDAAWRKAKSADDIRLDLVPFLRDGKVRVKVFFDEKPVEGAQVKAARPGMDDFEGETNAKGVVAFTVAESGVHSIRARHIEAADGEFNGKAYPETRHYSTLAVDVPTAGSSAATTRLQNVPQPVTSFGAAVVDNALYMYGGHTGGAHSYSKQEQSNQLTRLDLKTGNWKTIVNGPHLQGLALVAHGGKLYRIGGFTAMNAEGEEHDLQSQKSVACFDPATKTWNELPPLPEPRSSHDAAVVGDSLFVVGGWAMTGGGDSKWHDTALKLDLTEQPLQWQTISSPPFKRRALATAAHDSRLFVVGGMQDEGGPTTAVSIYDPAKDQWSEGPSLFVKDEPKSDAAEGDEKPRRSMSSGSMAGFGASAFATGGALYVTTVQGNLQRLSRDGARWEVISADITPRFFHRLLPMNARQLVVVGGSNMSIGKFEKVEVLDVDQGT